MSVVPSRSLKLLIALVLLLQLPSNAAWGQETDKTAAALEADRLKYENSLEVIRREVRAEIAQLYKKATREDDPVAARERVEAIEAAFESRGTLPEHKKENTWAKNYNAQKDQLERAYAQAIERYRAAGNEALVEALSAEQELFAKQLDLVPWGANLIESPVDVTAEKPLAIDADVTSEYRIQIRAVRTEGEGTLWVELPVSDQRRVRVPLVTGSDGSVRAILTVTPELVSADASAVRPVDIGGAMVGGGGGIAFVTDANAYVISTMEVKAVLYGVVRVADATHPARRDHHVDVDHFRAGMSGQGDCRHHSTASAIMRANVRIDTREGSRVDFIVTLEGTGESFRVTCRSDGRSLHVVNAQQLKAPAGKAPFTVSRIEGGSGSLRDGVLSLKWTMRGSSPNMAKNRAWTVEVRNVALR